MPKPPEAVIGPLFGGRDHHQLGRRWARNRPQFGKGDEPCTAQRGAVEQDSEDVAPRTLGESTELDVELDRLGLGVIDLHARLDLQLHDGTAGLVHQKEVDAVVVG